jgi:insulysin
MRHLVIKAERFDVQKEALTRQLRNWRLNEPSEHAIYYTSYLLSTPYWTNEEAEEALEGIPIWRMLAGDKLGIQAADVQAFIPELLYSLHIETLIHGNATKEEALTLVRVVQENLGSKPLDYNSIIGARSLLLPDGTHGVICLLTYVR